VFTYQNKNLKQVFKLIAYIRKKEKRQTLQKEFALIKYDISNFK